jgi:rRNA maturation endonuclease Nob1
MVDKPLTLRQLELQAISDSIKRHAGDKKKVAKELGISLKTVYNKLELEGDWYHCPGCGREYQEIPTGTLKPVCCNCPGTKKQTPFKLKKGKKPTTTS